MEASEVLIYGNVTHIEQYMQNNRNDLIELEREV
jgi:hypothetical protein